MTNLSISGRAAVLLHFALALAVGAAAPKLAAQAPAPAVPIVEPRLTRIFGSDSMAMWAPALSPDGRWVAFVNTEQPEANNIWVISTTGGVPVRLTSGRYLDMFPTWFPSGDRIAFRSNRPSTGDYPVMTIPFDSRTGQGAGPPRQVTLEHTWCFDVSPDGGSIVYWTSHGHTNRLMVVPSEGGTARRLFEVDDSTAQVSGPCPRLVWSSDREFVYFMLRRPGTQTSRIMRVSAAGGDVREMTVLSQQRLTFVYVNPDGRYVYGRIAQGPGQDNLHVITTIDGRLVARLALPRGMMPARFTPDGRGLVAYQSEAVAPIRVVPVAGGAVRQLTEARSYDWPVGWSPDGSRVFLMTSTNGHGAVLEAPIDGGPSSQWPIPNEARPPSGLSADGRYLIYSLASPDGTYGTVVVRRLADGWSRVVTRSAYSAAGWYGGSFVTGPGGSPGEEGFYFQRRGEQLELWAFTPEGPSRLLRSFPLSYSGQTSFGVHGNRIAYTERRGDSTAVFLAEGRNGTPRQLFAMAGSFPAPIWSHDGHWLAFDYYAPGSPSHYGVLVVGVGENGAVTAAPRILEVGAEYGWQIRWLPDDHGLTAIGGTGLATQVFLVSLREGERPVALTRDDPSTRWGYELSPDGRYVAYPAEIPRGSSIWRIDLGDMLTQTGRERSGTRQ